MFQLSYFSIFRKFEIFNRKEGRSNGGERARTRKELARVSFLLKIVEDRTIKKI